MIELVFIACLKTMPTACEERSLAYLDDVTPMACVMQAQPQLAQWTQTHPNHTIARWACQNKDQRGIKA